MFRRRRGYGMGGRNPLIIILALRLVSQIMRLRWKPPVTIGLMILNTLIFYQPSLFSMFGLNVPLQDICIMPLFIYQTFVQFGYFDWKRLFLSSLIHGSDTHLYFNMASLFYKGVKLEAALGSQFFFYIVLYSLFISHLLFVFVAIIGSQILPNIINPMQCAVGFSAVLFSLKYILNYYSPRSMYYFLGFQISSKWITWVELLFISLISPRASFLGHLCGILAGIIYTLLVGGSIPIFSLSQIWNTPHPRYTYTAQSLNGNNNRNNNNNNRNINEDEDVDLQRAIDLSLHDNNNYNNNNNNNNNNNDIRNKRTERYDKKNTKSKTSSSSSSNNNNNNNNEIKQNEPIDLDNINDSPSSMDKDELRRRRLKRYNKLL